MTIPACPSYASYRFPAEVISHAVWLYFRFPLSLRMVDELLAARGIVVSYETVRQWALKFGQGFANQIRRRLPAAGDKWHMDEVVITISGVKHWLWGAVDQTGTVLDILVQSRRDTKAAKRLLRALLKRQCRAPRVHDHRQAGELRSGQARGGALGRAPEAEEAEQQGGELAPADATTRAADEALQVSRAGAVLLVRPRRDQQPLPPSPPSSARHPVSSLPRQGLPGLGRGHRRRRCSATTNAPFSSRAIATPVRQVDDGDAAFRPRQGHHNRRRRALQGEPQLATPSWSVNAQLSTNVVANSSSFMRAKSYLG